MPDCTQGCNMIIETRDDVVVRLRPRPNLDVNRYFMCDHGRLNYRWMNRGDRIEAPLVRDGGAARRHRLGDRARPARADAPRRERLAVILASGRSSNESLGLVGGWWSGTT